MTKSTKPRAMGLNHIALEVGDIEEALAFYGRLKPAARSGWLYVSSSSSCVFGGLR
jgi:catechol 2,3-dioxygenase-like lactoylglutathione lyase family enzyme